MKQCINCYSGEIDAVFEKDRIFYYCSNCNQKATRIIDNNGKLVSNKENGLIKHVTVAAIIKSYNKILLIDRKKFPFGLCLPTGHLYQNESIEDALRKKVFEKTGYTINSKELILHETITDQCKSDGELHEWYLYECKVNKEQARNSYTNNIVWIDKDELSKIELTEPAKIILTKIGLIFDKKVLKKTSKNNSEIPKIRENKKSKSIKESIIENLPISIVVFDLKGKVAFSNTAATKFLDRAKNSQNGNDFIKALEAISKRASASKINVSSNLILDGNQYNIIANPIQNRGSTCGATITIQDITEKKSIEIRDVIAYETSLALCENQSFRKIIKTILKQLIGNMTITGCSLMLLENEDLKVYFQYSNTGRIRQKPLTLKIGQGIAGWVAENKTPLAITDTKKDPMFYGGTKEKENSLLAIPIVSSQKVLGVLNISKEKNQFFSESEIQTVSIVANRIALAIENEELYTQLNNDKKTLETVLSTTTDGLVLINKDRTIKFANQGMNKILGEKAEEYIGQDILNPLEKFSSENIKKFNSYFERSIINKKKLSTEFIFKKRSERMLHTVFNPIIEQDGSCSGILLGLNDITKLKKKEKQIQNQVGEITALFKIASISNEKSQEFFNRILLKTTELFHSKYSDIYMFGQKNTLSGRAIKLNSEMEEKVKEISKKGGVLFNNFQIQFGNMYEHIKIKRIAMAPIIIDKRIFGVLMSIDKKTNFNNSDLKLLSIIAERVSKKIESDNFIKKINDDRKQMTSIIENTGDGIIVFNPDYECLIWNKAIETMTGFGNFDQYKRKNPEVIKRIKDLATESYKTGIETIKRQIKIKNFDNQEIWLGVTYTFLRDNNSREYMIAVLRDISREITIDNQQKEFLYTATHELRTPITTIKGYLSMILNGDAGEINKKQNQYFGKVYESTNRLIHLVEGLLSVARLEENKITFEKKKIDLKTLVEEVVSEFENRAQEKNLKLKFIQNDNNQIYVIGDYDKTKHALSNLIDNAIKYTKKGKVEITYHENTSDKTAKILILDTGVGIPKKEQSQIFNKFYRVFNSESIKAGGTGLGLFIVKNLIEKQGGNIHLKSELGKGTEFSLVLPTQKTTENYN